MGIYLLFVVILALIGTRFGVNEKYMDIKHTTSVNGIFIFLVFYRHISQYAEYTSVLDKPMVLANRFLLQGLVTSFIVYSGYGIYVSICKNPGYVRQIPRRRILRIVLQYAAAVTIFLIPRFCLRTMPPLKNILLSYLGLASIGNSNWYIFFMVIACALTWIAFTVFSGEENRLKALCLLTFLIFIYILIIPRFLKETYCNTALVFPMGMWIGYFKEDIDRIFLKNHLVWLITFLFCLAILFLVRRPAKRHLSIYIFYMLFFAACILLFTMRAAFYNPVIYWCGKHLFGLYILQRLPMNLLRSLFRMNTRAPYLYAVLCIPITWLLALLFHAAAAGIEKTFSRASAR